jgi:hypothetical protein
LLYWRRAASIDFAVDYLVLMFEQSLRMIMMMISPLEHPPPSTSTTKDNEVKEEAAEFSEDEDAARIDSNAAAECAAINSLKCILLSHFSKMTIMMVLKRYCSLPTSLHLENEVTFDLWNDSSDKHVDRSH